MSIELEGIFHYIWLEILVTTVYEGTLIYWVCHEEDAPNTSNIDINYIKWGLAPYKLIKEFQDEDKFVLKCSNATFFIMKKRETALSITNCISS